MKALLVWLTLLMPSVCMAEVPYRTGDVAVDENFYWVNTQLKSINSATLAVSSIAIAEVTSNAFQFTGKGTVASPLTLNPSSVTLQGHITNITGNAGTVTNGVYTTGSYADPAWITSLSTSKIDLSTVTAAYGQVNSRLNANDAWVSTATSRLNAYGAFIATATTRLDSADSVNTAQQAWISTATSRLNAFDSFKTTATTRIDGNTSINTAQTAWISTATPRLDNLSSYSLSTGTQFGGDVSGLYGAISVSPDSHVHFATSTLYGVIASTATGYYGISVASASYAPGDNLGNHTATQDLSLATYNIDNVDRMAVGVFRTDWAGETEYGREPTFEMDIYGNSAIQKGSQIFAQNTITIGSTSVTTPNVLGISIDCVTAGCGKSSDSDIVSDNGTYFRFYGGNGDSIIIQAGYWNIDVPADSTVIGAKGFVEKYTNNVDAISLDVNDGSYCKLTDTSGGFFYGYNQCRENDWTLSSSTQIYGNSTYSWGYQISVDQANSNTFGWAMGIKLIADATVYIDVMKMQLFYIDNNSFKMAYNADDLSIDYNSNEVLKVSTFNTVAIMATPNPAYALNVTGKINNTGGFYKNGVEIGGGETGPIDAWITTATYRIDALDAFKSTASPTIGAHSAYISTASVINGAQTAFISTATQRLDAYQSFIATAAPTIGAHTLYITTATQRSNAFEAFKSTASSMIGSHEMFISTATSLIRAHESFKSTAAPTIGAHTLFITTATSKIDALIANISTAAHYNQAGIWSAAQSFTPAVTVKSSITITAASAGLFIRADSEPVIKFYPNNLGGGGNIYFYNESADQKWRLWDLGTSLSNKLGLYDATNSLHTVFTQAGYVGIGELSPTAKLVVNGNIVSSGTLTASTSISSPKVIASSFTQTPELCLGGVCSTVWPEGGGGGDGGSPIFQFQNFYVNTNGTNRVFQLSSAPVNNGLFLTKNGVEMVQPDDYTLYTDSITMVTAPVSSTTLAARYVVGYSSLTIANVTGTNNSWTGTNSFATGVTLNGAVSLTNVTFSVPAGSSVTWTCPDIAGSSFTAIQKNGVMWGCMQNSFESASAVTAYTAYQGCFNKYGGRPPTYLEFYIAITFFPSVPKHQTLTEWMGEPDWSGARYDLTALKAPSASALSASDPGSSAATYRCFIPR